MTFGMLFATWYADVTSPLPRAKAIAHVLMRPVAREPSVATVIKAVERATEASAARCRSLPSDASCVLFASLPWGSFFISGVFGSGFNVFPL